MIARKLAKAINDRQFPPDAGRTAKPCPACQGTGNHEGIVLLDCPHCNGYGLIRYNGTKFQP